MRAIGLVLALAGCPKATGTIPVVVSVFTSPPTTVSVRTPGIAGERALGQTPLDKVSGVFVGDVVMLRDAKAGIEAEEPIEFGSPGEHKVINKKFLLRAEP